jgi:hypothetical protein
MRLPARAVTGMAAMFFGFVNHFEQRRLERLRQFCYDLRPCRHGRFTRIERCLTGTT